MRCVVPGSATWIKVSGNLVSPETLLRLLADEAGQDLIEYALIFTFLALGGVATMKGVATSLGSFFGTLGTTLTSSV